MAICKIVGLLLRHFSTVFNETTETAAVTNGRVQKRKCSTLRQQLHTVFSL